MTELDRVGHSDNLISGGFHRFSKSVRSTPKSARSTRRQHEKKMEFLHNGGSATYL